MNEQDKEFYRSVVLAIIKRESNYPREPLICEPKRLSNGLADMVLNQAAYIYAGVRKFEKAEAGRVLDKAAGILGGDASVQVARTAYAELLTDLSGEAQEKEVKQFIVDMLDYVEQSSKEDFFVRLNKFLGA